MRGLAVFMMPSAVRRLAALWPVVMARSFAVIRSSIATSGNSRCQIGGNDELSDLHFASLVWVKLANWQDD
jgi:hypothetical protein